MTFWRRQNYGDYDIEVSLVLRGLEGRGGMNGGGGPEGLLRQ